MLLITTEWKTSSVHRSEAHAVLRTPRASRGLTQTHRRASAASGQCERGPGVSCVAIMAGPRKLLDLEQPISDRELISDLFYSVGMELGPHRVEQSLRFAQIIAEQFDVARVGALKSVVTDIAFDAAMNDCDLKAGFKSTVQKALGDHEFLKAREDKAASRNRRDRKGGVQEKGFCRGIPGLGMMLGEEGLAALHITAQDFSKEIGKCDPKRVALTQVQVCAKID